MAEMIWWCEVTELPYRCSYEIGTSSAVAHAACGSRILSAPGELIDPADLDYEAAKVPYLDTLAMFASKMLRITHEEAMEREDIKEAARLVARASVDAALGVGEPVEGSRE